MMFFKSITQEIKELINELSAPVTPGESRDGWRQEIKDRTRQFFEGIQETLRLKEPLRSLDIVRSLDHSGVTGGPLLNKIAKVINKLRSEERR